LITEFKIDFTKFSYLSGYCLLITGAIGIFIAAGTRKYGKRPGLIFSMICAFVGVMWAAFAKSYESFLGARMIQGLSMAYFESVVYAFIGDLYFVHERGTRMALFVITYQSLSNLPALVAGKMTENMGWRWVFYLLSIFVGIGLLLAIFFGWEVSYNREALEASEITTEEVGSCPARLAPKLMLNNRTWRESRRSRAARPKPWRMSKTPDFRNLVSLSSPG
jgi:MFS family permease